VFLLSSQFAIIIIPYYISGKRWISVWIFPYLLQARIQMSLRWCYELSPIYLFLVISCRSKSSLLQFSFIENNWIWVGISCYFSSKAIVFYLEQIENFVHEIIQTIAYRKILYTITWIIKDHWLNDSLVVIEKKETSFVTSSCYGDTDIFLYKIR